MIKNPQRFDFYNESFQNLPLYFLSFYGQTELEKVFEHLDYAIDNMDIQHVIIDNLQFLVGT